VPVFPSHPLPRLVSVGRIVRYLARREFGVESQGRQLRLDAIASHAVKKKVVGRESVEEGVHPARDVQNTRHRAMEVLEVGEVLAVRVVENPVELGPLGDELRHLVLPPPVPYCHVRFRIPPVGHHLGVHRRMRLDDHVQARIVRLQCRIDDAQSESDVQYPLSVCAAVR